MRVKVAILFIPSLLGAGAVQLYGYTYHASDFATSVVSADLISPFSDPNVVLGRPTIQMTSSFMGGNTPVPVVPVFPAYYSSDVATLNYGGSLVLHLDRPIMHDPANPYGRDLIVYGNSFFSASGSWANGNPNLMSVTGGGLPDGGTVGVSADSQNWTEFPLTTLTDGSDYGYSDGFAPTLGRVYDDVTPDSTLGTWNHWWGGATNPTVPLDPTLTPTSFVGKTVAQVAQVYGISAGGTSLDLSSLGDAGILSQGVSYVRVANYFTADDGVAPEVDAVAIVSPTQWIGATGTNYSNKLNWSSQVVPDIRTPAAYFLATSASPTAVTMDVPVNIALLKFDGTQTYTLTGTSTITLCPQMSGSMPVAPGITVLHGSHVIQAPLVLDGSGGGGAEGGEGVREFQAVTLTIATGSQLTVSGTVLATNANGATPITKAGAGLAAFPNLTAGTLTVMQGTFRLTSTNGPGVSVFEALGFGGMSGSPAGLLDLTNNSLILHDITDGGSGIRQALKNGITTAGLPNPTGIVGTLRNNQRLAYLSGADFLAMHPGQTVYGQTLLVTDWLVTPALAGDINLDGRISAVDLAQMDAAYLTGLTNATWLNGDLNYDGVVNAADYLIVDQNLVAQVGLTLAEPVVLAHANLFGQTYLATFDFGTIPEPASLSLLGLGVLPLWTRLRRGKHNA